MASRHLSPSLNLIGSVNQLIRSFQFLLDTYTHTHTDPNLSILFMHEWMNVNESKRRNVQRPQRLLLLLPVSISTVNVQRSTSIVFQPQKKHTQTNGFLRWRWHIDFGAVVSYYVSRAHTRICLNTCVCVWMNGSCLCCLSNWYIQRTFRQEFHNIIFFFTDFYSFFHFYFIDFS